MYAFCVHRFRQLSISSVDVFIFLVGRMRKSAFGLLLLIVECVLAKRVKRVYNGLPVEGRNVYSVTQYSVWISNSHECDFVVPSPVSDWIGRKGLPSFRHGCAPPKPYHLRGGGALISPNIIQTACHLVASFNKNGEKYTFGPATVLNPSEHRFTVYLGWNEVSEFKFGMVSKAYYSHPRCGWLVGFNPERIIYDYGWIVSDTDVLNGLYEDVDIDFAPMYTIQHLSDVWEASKMKQSTCLVMGWGYTNDRNKEPSNKLLHGWTVHLSYWECFKRSDIFSPARAKFKFVYERDAAWDCALGIPHFNQSQGNGDSGSPVTCNNQYVGIASWGSNHAGLMGYHAPLAFLPFENGIEYRKAFVESLNKNAYHPDKFTKLPSPTPWTPPPEHSLFQEYYPANQARLSVSGSIQECLISYCLVITFYLDR